MQHIHIYNLKVNYSIKRKKMLILLVGHLKVFPKKIYLYGVKYDVKRSKMTFLSNMSRKCMSEGIF